MCVCVCVCVCVCMIYTTSSLIYSAVDGLFGYFCILSTVNNAAMDAGVHVIFLN